MTVSSYLAKLYLFFLCKFAFRYSAFVESRIKRSIQTKYTYNQERNYVKGRSLSQSNCTKKRIVKTQKKGIAEVIFDQIFLLQFLLFVELLLLFANYVFFCVLPLKLWQSITRVRQNSLKINGLALYRNGKHLPNLDQIRLVFIVFFLIFLECLRTYRFVMQLLFL